MLEFIRYVFRFINSIYNSILDIFNLYYSPELLQSYNTFLNKNVFTDNSLIAVNITFNELFLFVFTWALLLTIIILFVKFVCKIISIFRVG